MGEKVSLRSRITPAVTSQFYQIHLVCQLELWDERYNPKKMSGLTAQLRFSGSFKPCQVPKASFKVWKFRLLKQSLT